MLMLIALDALDQMCPFPTDDVSEELVRTAVRIRDSSYLHYYQELIVPLAERGRHDLVRAVERKIAEYHRLQRLRDRNAAIGGFDRQHLGGNLARLRRIVSRRRIESAAAVPNTPTS
jgi:hypothetical protein